MEFPDGLFLSTILEREEPCDAFVSNRYDSIKDLPEGSIVGTSSLRRCCQLLNKRPDLKIQDLRGNVNTRLKKLDKGDYDAIILACAGLIRLDMAERIRQRITSDLILPVKIEDIYYISPELELISLYNNLYNPNKSDDWEDLLKLEEPLLKQVYGRAEILGGDCKDCDVKRTNDINILKRLIVKELISKKMYVLLGEWAYKILTGAEIKSYEKCNQYFFTRFDGKNN